MPTSTQHEPQLFEAPALFVEARYRERVLCARLLCAGTPRAFTIGGARRADAPVARDYLPRQLPANDNHALVEARAGGFVINLSPAMHARAERTATRLRVPCGEIMFDITVAAPAPRVPRGWLRRGWRDEARITGAVGLGLLALLGLVRAVPSDPHALSLDDLGHVVRLDSFRIVPPAVAEVAPAPGLHGPAAAGSTASGGASGAAGNPKARPADARGATKGTAVRQDARAVLTNPMLAILDGPHTGAVARVFAATPALGDHESEVLSHLDGRVVADAFGPGGLAALGTGRGGADTGRPTLGGPRGLDTIGLRGVRDGAGHGPGGPGALGHRTARVFDFIPSAPTVRGALDKEIVRRVVRQHVNEVRYCYEQALARRPSLAGRVVAQFTIAPTGRVLVSALQSSTLGELTVEACIVAAPRRWLFPQPSGGGLVTVSYPFQLAPAGG